MLLAASEGRHSRFEVCEHADGYLVQMRDLDTGELDRAFATIFRTMPVALAYAEMSAALDRFTAAESEDAEDEEITFELEERERTFVDLSDRLQDAGIDDGEVQAWQGRPDPGPRLTLH